MSSQTTSVGYDLGQNPANVTVTVLDSSGTVVKTIQTAVSDRPTCGWYSYCYNVSWDGTDDQGQTVSPGQYTIQVNAVNQDGTSTITALRDVADIPAPGSLTSPVADGTLSGLARFVYAPDNSFLANANITQVQWCLSTGGCVSAFNRSPDGTWQTTELTGGLVQGPATLYTTVYFTDPVGGGQSWTDNGTPVLGQHDSAGSPGLPEPGPGGGPSLVDPHRQRVGPERPADDLHGGLRRWHGGRHRNHRLPL